MNVTPIELNLIIGSIQNAHSTQLIALATLDILCVNLIHNYIQQQDRRPTKMINLLKDCFRAYLTENDIDPVAYHAIQTAISRASTTVNMIEALPD